MTEELTTVFTTALTQVQTDVVSMVKVAFPVGLAIMGLFLAIRLGIGFFKSVANQASTKSREGTTPSLFYCNQ